MAQHAESAHSLVAWRHGGSDSAAAWCGWAVCVSKDTDRINANHAGPVHTGMSSLLVFSDRPLRCPGCCAKHLNSPYICLQRLHPRLPISLLPLRVYGQGLGGKMALVEEFATLARAVGFQHDVASLINLQNMDKDSEGADGSGNSSERYYCPYPNCKRSFAELWRLKVHYRCGGARQHKEKGWCRVLMPMHAAGRGVGWPNSHGLHRR